MKNCFSILFIFLLANLYAQKNNQYNQYGVDYINSIEQIQKDIDDGKVKDFNTTTLNYYSRKIPLTNQVNMEIVGQVSYAIKKKNFNSVLNSSSMSSFSKKILEDAFSSEVVSISSLVDKVNKNNNLGKEERKTVLSLLAITDALLTNNAIRNARGNCTVNGQTGPGACTAAGAAIGFLVGGAICGLPCALGGAIVGGLIGSGSE